MLLAAIQSRMLCLVPQHSGTTSSPPKCTYSSSKVLFIYFMTSVTTSQVRGRLGSNCPMQRPLQVRVMSLYFSLLPQDWVWAGESIYGTTLIPLILAYSMTVLMSDGVKTPPIFPDSLSSGMLGTSIGKASSSMMCQWSTLSLEQSIESMALRMVARGRQCLDVSIIRPLHLKEGTSSTEMGRSVTTQLSLLSFSNSCEKVSNPLRNPGQQSAVRTHCLSTPNSSEQAS